MVVPSTPSACMVVVSVPSPRRSPRITTWYVRLWPGAGSVDVDDEVLGGQGAHRQELALADLVLRADQEVLTGRVGGQGGRVVGEGDVLARR